MKNNCRWFIGSVYFAQVREFCEFLSSFVCKIDIVLVIVFGGGIQKYPGRG